MIKGLMNNTHHLNHTTSEMNYDYQNATYTTQDANNGNLDNTFDNSIVDSYDNQTDYNNTLPADEVTEKLRTLCPSCGGAQPFSGEDYESAIRMKTFKMIGDNKELQGQMNTPVENQNSMYENRVLKGDTETNTQKELNKQIYEFSSQYKNQKNQEYQDKNKMSGEFEGSNPIGESSEGNTKFRQNNQSTDHMEYKDDYMEQDDHYYMEQDDHYENRDFDVE